MMKVVLTLNITLQEPLLATGMEGDPNSGSSLPYIPASLLRGVAIARYGGNKEAADSDFRRLFLDATTRFINGYPIINGQRALPCPRSLMKDKYRGMDCNQVYDHSAPDSIPADRQWQSVSNANPFVVLNQNPSFGCRPSRTIQVHTNRNRRLGRATVKDGAVFRYESLSPKQLFRGHIICEERDVQTVKTLLAGEACLGGSRTAGYGHATITVAEETAELAAWNETGSPFVGGDLSGAVFLTLLSDTILCDPATGQHSTAPEVLCHHISNALNIATLEVSSCRFFLQPTLVGGFNRKWGLPLVQTPALGMGSVMVISNGSLAVDALANLERNGIGQRQAEGFGRVAVNWHQSTVFELKDCSGDYAPSSQPDHQDAAIATIQSRLRRQRIENEVKAQALKTSGVGIPADCRSRLQNLRLQVMNEIRNGVAAFDNQSALKNYLEKIESRKPVRNKYDKIRIRIDDRGIFRILNWLKEWLGSPSSIQTTIPNLGTGADESVRLTGSEAYRFRLQVAHLVLGRLVKDSKQTSRTR